MNPAGPFRKLARQVRVARRRAAADYFVVSYPKSGRTWLRVMLAKALALHYGIAQEIVYDPAEVKKAGHSAAPRVRFTHGSLIHAAVVHGSPAAAAEQFRGKKIIFLVRDPRDVVVSYYFHHTRREGGDPNLSISDFIRSSAWSMEKIINFMNGWYEYRDLAAEFLLIRYEDLQTDAAHELRRVLAFIGLEDVQDDTIRQAVEYSSFNNLRKMSLNESELGRVAALRPTNPDDPDSFKVRQGKVGGYVQHMEPDDLDYVNAQVRDRLLPVFGYH